MMSAIFSVQVEIFWVVMPCSSILHPEDGGSKVLWNVSILPQLTLCGIITQEPLTWIFTAVKTSNLTTFSLAHITIHHAYFCTGHETAMLGHCR